MRPIGRSQRAVRVEPLRWSPNKCNSGHCDNYTRWRHARPSAVSEHANAICYALTGCPLLGGQIWQERHDASSLQVAYDCSTAVVTSETAGIAAWRSTGATFWTPWYLSRLAW